MAFYCILYLISYARWQRLVKAKQPSSQRDTWERVNKTLQIGIFPISQGLLLISPKMSFCFFFSNILFFSFVGDTESFGNFCSAKRQYALKTMQSSLRKEGFGQRIQSSIRKEGWDKKEMDHFHRQCVSCTLSLSSANDVEVSNHEVIRLQI